MKVYDLIIPGGRRDPSKALLDALVFGSVNFAVLFWPFTKALDPGFALAHPGWQYFLLVGLLFLAPLAWPVLYVRVCRLSPIRTRIVPPTATAWDDVFMDSQRRGRNIG